MKRNYYFLILTILFYSCTSITLREGLIIDVKEDWLQSGRDEEKSNISGSGSVLNPPFAKFWKFNSDAAFSKNALSVCDGVLFASCLNGDVFAVDLKNGAGIGKAKTKSKSCFSAPLIFKDKIVLTFSDGINDYITGYDFTNGDFSWKKKIERCVSSPSGKDGNIFISTTKGNIYKLSSEGGKQIWVYKNDSPFFTSTTICGDIIFAGDTKGFMTAVDINSGVVKWKYKTDGGIYSDVSVYKNNIFFGSDDKNYYCLDTGGNLVWKKELNTKFLSSSTFYSGNVICTGINGMIFSLDLNTGGIIWEYQTNGTITASPVFQGGKIFFGSYDKYFYCLDANRGEVLWKYEFDERIRTSAVIWKNFLIVACDDKSIYCFK